MPISKIKTSSITADAASINLNIDANTLFVDVANNRVGVNNISPSTALQISGTTTSTQFRNNGASGHYGWTAGSQGAIFTTNSTPGLAAQFIVDNAGRGISVSTQDDNGASTGTQFRLGLGASTGATGATMGVNDNTTGGYNTLTIGSSQVIFNRIAGESMRITSAGDLALGSATSLSTSAGRTDFTINGSSNSIISFGVGGTRQGYLYAPSSGMILTSETGVLNLQTTAAYPIYLTTNNSERIRIDTSGNTMIGGGAATSSAGFLQINTQVPNTSSSSLGFNSLDNAVISSKYSLVFQVNNTNSISGRSFEYRTGGKGYGDGTPLFSINSNGSTYQTAVAVGNLASNSISSLPAGTTKYSFSCLADDTWRVLVTNFSNVFGIATIQFGDQPTQDIARYGFSLASPAYGVQDFTQLWFKDGAWPSGSFAFRYVNVSNVWRLEFKFASYYSSANTGSGNIIFEIF